MIRRVSVVLAAIAVLLSVLPVVPALALEESPDIEATESWWVEWLAAFDLNGNLIDDAAESVALNAIASGNAEELVPVIATFSGAPSEAKVAGLLARLEAGPDAYTFKTQPMVDLDVPARNLLALATEPGLVAVEHDRELKPALNVSSPSTQSNNGSAPHDFHNGKTAEDLGYVGEDMVVAVLDTGVTTLHEAFAGKWIAGAEVAPQVPLYCVDPQDDNGHGTHVASTAVGSMPADDLFGTAMGAKLVEVKIAVSGATGGVGPVSVGSSNRGFEFVKLYNDALESGTPLCGPSDDHIDVATLSFGSLGRGGPNAGTTEAFIDDLVGSGVAVTVAVGNCGPVASATCTFSDTDNGISSPGNAAGAISVASSNDINTVNRNDDIISAFSSRGPNSAGSADSTAGGATSAGNLFDRYRKPEIAAPGQNIVAADIAPGGTTSNSGTSMAAPHMAGIAALLLEAGEDAKAETGGVNLMASTGNGYVGGSYVKGIYPVRDAVIHSTDYKSADAVEKWTGPNSKGLQWNNAWGYGQVDAFAALCWAWDNVLAPGGATRPPDVADTCASPPPPPPLGSRCSLNFGVLTLSDARGDAGFVGVAVAPPEYDVHELRISEPSELGPGKILFKLKMASLEDVPPDTTWPVVFKDHLGADRWVRMATDPTGVVSFASGIGTNPGLIAGTPPAPNPGMAADPQSSFDPDGTIWIIVDRADIGGLDPGDTIGMFQTRIRVQAGTSSVTPDNMPDDLSFVGSYTLVGSENCADNDDPVAVDDVAETLEDVPVTIDVLANDSDPDDGDTISIVELSGGAFGSTTDNGDGTVTYTPNPNANGVDEFTYTISDGKGGMDSAKVTVTVTAVPDDPVAVDDSAATEPETPVTIEVLFNDFDVDGDALSVVSVTAPGSGTAIINADDTITYTPDAGFEGPDSFVYTIDDGTGRTDSATVSVDVKARTCFGDPFFEDVEDGVHPGWSFETAIDHTGSYNWMETLDPFAESPDNSFSSDAQTSILVKDDRLISPSFDVSEFSELTFWHRFSFAEGTGGPVDGGVLEVSTDGGSTWADIEEAAGVFVTGGYNGTMRTSGSVIPGRDAWVSFSTFIDANDPVVVDLGGLAGETIRLRWRLTLDATIVAGAVTNPWFIDDIGVSDLVVDCPTLPEANDDEATVGVGGTVNIDVLANDSDPEGALDVSIETAPSNGTATVVGPSGSQTIDYAHDGGASTTDEFIYGITDPDGNFDSAVVSITVNQAPAALDDEASVERGESVNIEVLTNDSDPEGDPLDVSIETDPSHGTAVVETDGTITYDNGGSPVNSDEFTYRITDPFGNFDVATVTISITPPPPEGGGKVTGGGWLATDEAGKLNFGFNAEDQGEEGLHGNLQLNDKDVAVKIHADELTSIGALVEECGSVGGPDAMEFRMTGKFNAVDGATFRICVEDNGEPGQQSNTETPDAFYLECLTGCAYDTGARTPEDKIDGGNIQIHEAPAESAEGSSEEGSDSASVLILDPLLASEAGVGTLFQVTIRAYGTDGELIAGVPIDLIVNSGGIETTLSGVSDLTGLVTFQLVVPAAGFDLEARTGSLGSNFVNISVL